MGLTVLGLALLFASTRDYLTDAVFDSTRFGAKDIPGNQSVRGMLLRTPLSDTAVGVLVLWAVVVDLQGLTAVAGALALPGLLSRSRRGVGCTCPLP